MLINTLQGTVAEHTPALDGWYVKKSGFGTLTTTFYGGTCGTPKIPVSVPQRTRIAGIHYASRFPKMKDQAITTTCLFKLLTKNLRNFHFCVANLPYFRDFGI